METLWIETVMLHLGSWNGTEYINFTFLSQSWFHLRPETVMLTSSKRFSSTLKGKRSVGQLVSEHRSVILTNHRLAFSPSLKLRFPVFCEMFTKINKQLEIAPTKCIVKMLHSATPKIMDEKLSPQLVIYEQRQTRLMRLNASCGHTSGCKTSIWPTIAAKMTNENDKLSNIRNCYFKGILIAKFGRSVWNRNFGP